ncbi:metal ABC transporter permease [Halovivax gelatinilyticus]|uniref:metal ABC transporter permease n=1 Tax=Halovivax gelatinilyticus TaxID=2961597 RepID=UPI0020CA6D17|nr:metal ABC transporter permease [Halovivax gelatinilyticus]
MSEDELNANDESAGTEPACSDSDIEPTDGESGETSPDPVGADGGVEIPETETNGGPVESNDDRATRDARSPIGFGRIGSVTFLAKPADRRGWIVSAGIGVTATLAVFMLGFIALDWLRHYPLAESVPVVESIYQTLGIDPYAERLFGQFLIAGAWLDYALGTDIFRFAFYWRSLATGVLIGIVAPLVGAFVVHRQMALIGETLAHTAFAGIAVGLVLAGLFEWWGAPLMLVALVVGVLGAVGVQWLTDRTDTYGDVPIAIMLVGSFAVGTLLIEWARGIGTVTIDIEAYLFGNITIVPAGSARLMAVLSLGVLAVVAFTYKQLLFITFDEQAARVAQLDVGRYNTILIVMTAVVVVGSMQILGVILVAAMLVVPVAAASQIARSFREMVLLSICFGEVAIVAGFAFAFSADLPPGGSIVVAAIALYVLTVVRTTHATSLSTH